MNELTQKDDVARIASIYRRAAAKIGTGQMRFLRFVQKESRWALGAELQPVTETDIVAINFNSLRHGVVGWQNKEKVYDVMVPLNEDTPEIHTLPPIAGAVLGDDDDNNMNGYSYQMGFSGTFVRDKTEFAYSNNSEGCKQMVGRLASIIAAEAPYHPEYPNPVLKLKAGHYNHKKWGRLPKPDFEVLGWCNYQMEMWDPTTDDVQDLIG